ncbi:MAG: helix-turn-helix transcriptional regulator [Clostridiaceae bacterium]|jgi:AraC-like DNA-binding protein|nr:helix-turn-helix transcriptional regulator [Clostridiaceae bacterium]
MLINNKLIYEKEYLVTIGKPTDSCYYFFDYDERYYDINMEFQHFHNFYEIHILLDDYAAHIIEGNLYRIGFLDFVCLKPYSLHKSEYPDGPAKKRLIIQFNVPDFPATLQGEILELLSLFEAPLPIYRFEQNHQDLIIDKLNEIYTISKIDSPINILSIHSKFYDLLCTIYNLRDKNTYQSESLNATTAKIYSIASYIHNHFNEELTLDVLAQHFYISKYYLSHLFKDVTGFTLTNYIQMTRIRNAQQLLLFSDKKITDIAIQCGFTSFSQFNRVFNKFCKSSPRDYRNKANLDYSKGSPFPSINARD